jgi:hypothetical protein
MYVCVYIYIGVCVCVCVCVCACVCVCVCVCEYIYVYIGLIGVLVAAILSASLGPEKVVAVVPNVLSCVSNVSPTCRQRVANVFLTCC